MAGLVRSRSQRTFGAGHRRKTSWALGPKSNTDGATATTISTSIAVLGGVGAAAALDGITVVRLRGEFVFNLLTATAVGDGFFGAFGVGLARNPAFTAGAASVPMPIDEEFQENWLYHRYFACLANGQISAAGVSLSGGQNGLASIRVEVDSKAMRKLNIGDTIYAAVQVTENATATANWSFNSRMLVKQQG